MRGGVKVGWHMTVDSLPLLSLSLSRLRLPIMPVDRNECGAYLCALKKVYAQQEGRFLAERATRRRASRIASSRICSIRPRLLLVWDRDRGRQEECE